MGGWTHRARRHSPRPLKTHLAHFARIERFVRESARKHRQPAVPRVSLALHCHFGNCMTHTEKLLRELIALPSVNPAFLPAQDPRAGEQRVAEFLAATGAQAGLDVEFQLVAKGRSNLLARLSPRGKVRQRVLLAPHLDTVNATEEQFTPGKRNGRLFGRGACDTKGSVAMMLMALCDLAQAGRRPADTEIVIAGFVDEEH